MEKVILKKENEQISTIPLAGKLYERQPDNEEVFTKVQYKIRSLITTVVKKSTGNNSDNSKNAKPSEIDVFYNKLFDLMINNNSEGMYNLVSKRIDEYVKERVLKNPNYHAKYKKEYTDAVDSLISNKELVISTITNRILAVYYLDITKNLSNEKIHEISDALMNMSNIEDLMAITLKKEQYIPEKCYAYQKSKIIFLEVMKSVHENLNKHLCWDGCAIASPMLCPKVSDAVKKNIDEYDFIKSGYQVIDENGFVEEFVVTDCDKFEQFVPKKLTAEDKHRIRQIRKELVDYLR